MDDFDKWNVLKKSLHVGVEKPQCFPKCGEVWMAHLGKNIGFEQNGSGSNFSRPMLITKKFNNHMFWAVPLTTKQKSLDFFHNFTDPNGIEVAVILAQLRLVSVSRMRRKLYELPANQLQEIIQKLKILL